MATGARRDDAALAEGLARWVAAHPEVPVPGRLRRRRPSAGDASRASCTPTAAWRTRPCSSSSGRVATAWSCGCPRSTRPSPTTTWAPRRPCRTPRPRRACPLRRRRWSRPIRRGSARPFLAMPRVRGDIAGPAPVFDPYVREADPARQLLLHDGLIDSVAAIHAVPWEAAGLGARAGGTAAPGPRRPLGRLRRVVVGGRPAACAGRGPGLVRPPRPARARRRAAVGRRAAGQPRLRRRRPGRRRCSTGTSPPWAAARWISAGTSGSSS